MYKICQTEQSVARQRELEKGLLQLMLRKNYEEISVSDLCEHLHVPRKAFYRYFDNKEGALYALIDHTIADFFQSPRQERQSQGAALRDLDLFFVFWYENKSVLDALQKSALSGILVERATNFALNENYLPRQFQLFDPAFRSVAMAFSVCGLMSMVLQWHHQGFLISPEQMTQLAVTILTKPLLNPH